MKGHLTDIGGFDIIRLMRYRLDKILLIISLALLSHTYLAAESLYETISNQDREMQNWKITRIITYDH